MTSPYRGVEQLAARRAHNPEAVGSSPTSATIKTTVFTTKTVVFSYFLGKNKNYIKAYESIKELPKLVKQNSWLKEVK